MDLRAANADELKVIGIGHGGQPEEASLHANLSDSRQHGEWFRISEDLLYALATVNVTGSWPKVLGGLRDVIAAYLDEDYLYERRINRRFFELCKEYEVEPDRYRDNYRRGRFLAERSVKYSEAE